MHVAVIDIGKTNLKVVLVDSDRMAEVAAERMPNRVIHAAPYSHYPTDEHWSFLLDALGRLHAAHGVDAVSITTHGATGVLVDEAGELVLPILDYEDHGPDALAADYDAIRPDFSETGSPRLPGGLTLGAQSYWQFRTFPEAERTRYILTYPQYWALRLTGVAAVEPTSLGCHTDLWRPETGEFSSLVERMGWRRMMPPVRAATDVLGSILPDVAARTGLAPTTPVVCGIHDSNASLYPHLLSRAVPFAVVSTGTWVIAMAVGGVARVLDPSRDTLVNVGADGRPVPSARFMGGREYEVIRAGQDLTATAEDRRAVLSGGIMLLPSVEQGSGPYPDCASRWTAQPANPGQKGVALAWYLALMTAECLSMIGARGTVVVEGPFARNADYLAMLAAATGRGVVASENNSTGTAFGAALLIAGRPPATDGESPIVGDLALATYAAQWRSAVERHASVAIAP